MEKESRVKKSLLNARVNLITYVLVLGVTFFSRRMFIDKLGGEFVGLTTTLSNLLSFLNLAELGVGTAVGYMLFKPLLDGRRQKINEIISVFGFIYRRLGYVILIGAILLGAFLPLILNEEDRSMGMALVYFLYTSYMVATLLSYFVNYKQLLLVADQRQYVVTGYYQGANILRLLVQMLVLYRSSNPFYWVAIEIAFSFIYSWILNTRIRKAYPFLDSNLSKGKALFKEYPEIMRYTKQIFVHRVAANMGIFLPPAMIYFFAGGSLAVTAYMNYQVVIARIQVLVVQLLGSTDAGVGQLVAQGEKDRPYTVFKELLSLRYFICGCIAIIMWFTTSPFIGIWLNAGFILPDRTLFLLLFIMFAATTRSCVDSFLTGYGLFHDIWAPIVETVINIGVSVACGILWGMDGVLFGSAVSMFLMVMLWKPYFLFSKGFSISVWKYWKVALRLYLLIGLTFGAVYLFVRQTPLADPGSGVMAWIVFTAAVSVLAGVVLFGLMYLFDPGIRIITDRFSVMIKNRLSRKQA